MKRSADIVAALVSRTSPRERRLLGTLAALAAAAVVYLAVVEPLATERLRLDRGIVRMQSDLDGLTALAARIRQLEDTIAQQQSRATAVGDFSLLPFVERAVSASVSQHALESMSPKRRKRRDGSEEVSVELKLSAVQLSEIVSLLRTIEESPGPVYINRLELRRRYDDHSRFDAVVVATANGPA